MLSFDPEVGMIAPSTEEVREAQRKRWIDAFRREGLPPLDTAPETPAGQLIDSETAALMRRNAQVLALMQQFNPLTAEGIFQEALGKIYYLTPKAAQSSVAVCTCKGLPGTVIRKGSVIRSNVDGTEWIARKEQVIPKESVVEIPFIAREVGPLIAKPATLTQIVTVTPGWDSVLNKDAAIIGNDRESQRSFETRRYNSVAANARGSLAAIYGALADLPGVLDLVVLENTTSAPVIKHGVSVPAHGIWITIVGGDDVKIAETIYRKKDAGCDTGGSDTVTFTDTEIPGSPAYTYRIERPEPVAFKIKVVINRDAATPENFEAEIKKKCIQNFLGEEDQRVGTAQTVYASRFYRSVIAAGVQSIISLQVQLANEGWTDTVVITAAQVPTLSPDDIVIEEA